MKTIRGPRYIAIEILCRREESLLPVDQVMDAVLSGASLDDSRDRQLIMSMVYGVLRWRGYLDWVIAEFSSHPIAKMQNRTLQGLRVGLFQLIFLDRVPPSAAINETVQALKDMKQPTWLTGFINGLLRNVDRKRGSIPTPFNNKPLPESALLSHPAWLIERWKKRYGETGTVSICQSNNRIAPLFLRTNQALTTRSNLLKILIKSGLLVALGKYSPLAVKITGFQGAVPRIPGFNEGLFQVQDEAAQMISMLFGTFKQGQSYLDGCAGLGGKTSHLAQLLPENCRLTAVEPSADRLEKLRQNLARLQLDTTVTIVEGTVQTLLPDMKEKFAGVLIDAPCSGIGVIRRHPDIRWNRTPEDLLRYQETQSEILKTAAQLVSTGGTLIYATCSTEPEENEEVVQAFLAANPSFILGNCGDALSGNASSLVDNMGFFRTIPGQDDLDGFFAARLIKM